MNLIRHHYRSEQVAAYTFTCAFCRIFNTGVLLMLASARFNGGVADAFGFSQGQFYDFNPNWFVEVSPLITQTYLLVVLWPFIDFAMFYPLRKLHQWYDQGSFCCFGRRADRTRQTNMTSYIEIHGGPEIQLHDLYAELLTLIFVAFMHGMAQPVLFIYCLIGIAI